MAGCSMVIIEEKQEKVNREKRVKAVLFTKEQRFFFDAMKKVMGLKQEGSRKYTGVLTHAKTSSIMSLMAKQIRDRKEV